MSTTDARQMLSAAGYTAPETEWAGFLETIHGDARGFIELCFIDAKDRAWRRQTATIDEAVFIIGQNLHLNVYVGVSKRKLPARRFGPGAGGKRNLSECSAFWIDWDPRDDYRDDDDAVGHREELFAALDSCPLGGPSLLVWSGSGIHGYWLFEEPEDVSTPEACARFERVTKALCRHFGTDLATSDASRVLRIPATINWPNAVKRAKGRIPAVAGILQRDMGRRQ